MHEALSAILEATRVTLSRVRESCPPEVLRTRPQPPLRDFPRALSRPGTSFIAEIKRRSPSSGRLMDRSDAAGLARTYESHGARALSVLTEERFFNGSKRDLLEAREAVSLPVLRKDFVLDPAQIRETRLLGADAVLLIVRILGPGQLDELLATARELDLPALVEVHDEGELRRALDCGAEIVGVNSRDLESFDVDLERAFRLGRSIPHDRTSVAESGIRRRDDVLRLERAGFQAVLVGEALVRSDEPGARLRELAGDARASAAGERTA
jgi:indole-3-glycerol phosphate synthase